MTVFSMIVATREDDRIADKVQVVLSSTPEEKIVRKLSRPTKFTSVV